MSLNMLYYILLVLPMLCLPMSNPFFFLGPLYQLFLNLREPNHFANEFIDIR